MTRQEAERSARTMAEHSGEPFYVLVDDRGDCTWAHRGALDAGGDRVKIGEKVEPTGEEVT